MNWGDVGMAVVQFFAAVGIMTVVLIVIAFIGIHVEERKRDKQARLARADKWDRQSDRIDQLWAKHAEQAEKIRTLNMELTRAYMRITDLGGHTEQLAEGLDTASQVADIMAGKVRGQEAKIGALLDYAHGYGKRIEKLEEGRENQQAINQVVYDRFDIVDNNISLLTQAAEKTALGGLELVGAGEKLEQRVTTLEKNDKDHDYWEESTDRQLNSIEDDISDLQIDVANLQAEKEAA